MTTSLIAQVTVNITAPVAKVWEALITPALIKQYLFGTDIMTDWKVGSAITYKGIWQGKSYEDKGKILAITPEKQIKSTYWSSMSGTEDKPENYVTVTYDLTPTTTGTQLVLTQDNNTTEEAKSQSEKNWAMVLDGLKKLVEK